jgi:membrane associated rhomboid family serine protease
VSSCPACGALVEPVQSVLGAAAACVPCDLAWFSPASTALASSGAYFHSYSPPTGRQCPTCGRNTAARNVIAGKHAVAGWHCANCDRFASPLAPLLRLGRPARPPRPVKEAVPSREPTEVRTIDERDRVFSFLLGLPLELSEGIDRRPPVTMALVGICVAVFVAEIVLGGDFADSLALHTEYLSYATAWQLATCIFVHVSAAHLLGNLYFLVSFGALPEARLGPLRFAALFLLSGLAGSVLFLCLNLGEATAAAGASGSVSGLLGFYFLAFPRHRVGVSLFFKVIRVPALLYLGLWFILQIGFFVMDSDPVAYSAHLGGFLTGVALGVFYKRRSARP